MPDRAGSIGRMRLRTFGTCTCGVLLIELMIGIAIGLLIAAAAVTFVAGHLNDNRRLLLESRLMQDLRTAADIITRDLRRAGYWASASDGIALAGAGPVSSNPYVALAPSAAASGSVSFAASKATTGGSPAFGSGFAPSSVFGGSPAGGATSPATGGVTAAGGLSPAGAATGGATTGAGSPSKWKRGRPVL